MNMSNILYFILGVIYGVGATFSLFQLLLDDRHLLKALPWVILWPVHFVLVFLKKVFRI